MLLFSRFTIDRNDIIKFCLLSLVFSFSLSAYNHAFSPVIPTTFDSASILSFEEPVELSGDKKPEELPVSTEALAEPAALVISFRPKNIVVDSTLLDKIRINAESRFFRAKISPLNLLVDGARKEPRGQVSGNTLILSGKIPGESESLKVFVHELGHIVDISYLPSHEDGSDISDRFYRVSWKDYAVKKEEAKIADFVSGYALSNKYEDFAESFAFYVFHNDEFARRAAENEALRAKYDFFRDEVFEDRAFFSTDFAVGTIRSYNWDTTKIGINTKKYLYYIK